MKIKGILFSILAILALASFAVPLMLQGTPDVYLDTRMVNDIVRTISVNWEDILNENGIPSFEYDLDYVVIGNDGNLIAATRRDRNENINDAIRNRDTIIDIDVDGEMVGKVIFYNDTANTIQQNKTSLVFTTILIIIILTLIFAAYTFYLHFTLLRPFNKLQSFARQIAVGDFDIPLEMDRKNLFGAFTEGFDLMREELHRARENERKADRSKKELVASLSHDIKTPIASIQAVTELMLFTAKDKEDKVQLEIINEKAEQINSLITNMFHATLEELQTLNVNVIEIQSTAIPNLIRNADYKGRVKPFFIPNCLILSDLLRLGQMFDNIISNSYKYAGTDIEIHTSFEGPYLAINIIDFGPGVSEEELPLITNKFYRGKDTNKKSGYGLGLYISKYLSEQMLGDLRCENSSDGFSVRLLLRLA